MTTCTNDTAQRVRQYDDGVKLIVQIVDCTLVNGEPTENVVDVSQMLSAEILLRKPDGETVMTLQAQHLTDGTDGKIFYSTHGDPSNHTGDLDQPGTWTIQGRVRLNSGYFTSQKGKFKVEPVLDAEA